jgi:hypothetical protein
VIQTPPAFTKVQSRVRAATKNAKSGCVTFWRSDLLNIIYILYDRNKAVSGHKARTPEGQKVTWYRSRR